MSRFLLLLSAFIFSAHVQAAAPSPADYLYEARLNTGPMKVSQVIKAPLSEDVLRHVAPNFGNLQLLDDLNGEPVFTLYDQPPAPIRSINKLKVSSNMEETPSENLLDDNRLTAFAFDQKIDANNPAVLTIDFGKMVNLHRLELWPTQDANILGMELKYGLKMDEYKTLRRKTAFSPVIDSDFPTMKWLEISLWGSDVYLEDFNAFGRAQAEIYFTAEPDRRYRLVFGGPVDNKRYGARVSVPERFDQKIGFTKPQFNTLAEEDFDEDSVLNVDDNCPHLKNENQADDDEDGWGNACDNAEKVKNYAQSDIDLDGIGDIIDNCKLEPNPSQKDKDKDGYGDECDNAYGKASSANKNTVTGSALPYGLIGGLAALLAVLGLGVFVGKKRN